MRGTIKKFILIGCFFALSGALLCADDETALAVHGLLKKGLYKNYDQIAEESYNLTASEKMLLLDAHEKTAGLPFTANLLIGFGLGSYMQGDTTGGTIQLVGELVGVASMIAGSVVLEAGMIYTLADTVTGDYTEGPSSWAASSGSGLILAGYALTAALRIYGCISPFVFKARYNTKLKSALNYYSRSGDRELSISSTLVPSIDRNGNGAVTALLSFKL
ncbi:MAG: P13 family porin [Spirochaetaceae bacterium]|nr:P13 family porin [Spirochaetaceae bacterium]